MSWKRTIFSQLNLPHASFH